MNSWFRRYGVRGGFLVLIAAGTAVCFDQLAKAAVTKAWVRQYNSVVSNSHDVATAVLRDRVGNVVVAGYSDDGFGAGADLVLIKFSGADGSLLWRQQYDGVIAISGAAMDANGNVAVAGHSNWEDFDYFTAKYSSDGTLLWVRRFDGPSDDKALAVAFDSKGNVVVTGGSSQDDHRNDDDDLTAYDYFTVKYAAADGAVLWERRYNGPGGRRDLARAVVVDTKDNVVVTGSSDSEFSRDHYTVKYEGANGTLLWEHRHQSSTGYDVLSAVTLDASGNVVVAGSEGYANSQDIYVAKYAEADGALIWEQRHSGTSFGADAAQGVVVDGSGNVIITGHSARQVGYADIYTAKYAGADGTLLWERLYNGPAGSSDIGEDVTVDASDNVVVTGYSFGANTWDRYTAKYAASDGALLWERRRTGPYWSDLSVAVLVDPSGDVLVTGGANGGSDPDIHTAKYAASDGSVLWEHQYTGPSHRTGLGDALAVDRHGNVIVTGYAEGEESEHDYLTLKYSPNGTLLWEKRYDSPGNGGDYPRALGLDADGNVAVTGYSSGGGNAFDFYTVKYAAADGAVLWEHRYDGPAHWDDHPSALAVDGSGNVIVTGLSTTAEGYVPYTAKYAAANGALIWQQLFDDPLDVGGAAAVAVDANGNVIVTGRDTVKYAAATGAVLWNRVGGGAVKVDRNGDVIVTSSRSTTKYGGANGAQLWQTPLGGWALAIDANGNALVTESRLEVTGSVPYTVKYAAANGAQLWTTLAEPGSAILPTILRAVAADEMGNVVVAGMSYDGTGRGHNFFTAKYAAADGAVLWQQHDDGPGQGDDRIEDHDGLALGPNGMVAITGSSGGFHGSFFGNDFTTVIYRDTPSEAPQIRITSPANGSQWLVGATITLAAAVTDPDGIVDAVEFFVGDTSLGVSDAFPWTLAWSNVPLGTFTLTAEAMDTLGPISVSDPITITVANPPAGPAVNVFATDPRARERSHYFQPDDTATFLVHRTSSLNSTLVVYYELAGTASNGVDYIRLPGRVTIPAGHRTTRIVVIPRKDSLREGHEQVLLNLLPPPAGSPAYTLGTRTQAGVTISD